jgi:hypothetical protein
MSAELYAFLADEGLDDMRDMLVNELGMERVADLRIVDPSDLLAMGATPQQCCGPE